MVQAYPDIGFSFGPGRETLDLEWLVTNGIGGYASGTVANVATRRYHSYLVAAFSAPLGRYNLISGLREEVRLPDGSTFQLSAGGISARPETEPARYSQIEQFRLDFGIPVWRYSYDGFSIERRILMPHAHNTVHITYRYDQGTIPIVLMLTPAIDFRPHEAEPSSQQNRKYTLTRANSGFEVTCDETEIPPLRMILTARQSAFDADSGDASYWLREEVNRGYPHESAVWCPGCLSAVLSPGQEATLIASTASWEEVVSLTPEVAAGAEVERREKLIESATPALQQGVAQQVILAADQFIISPVSRIGDLAQRHAAGEEPRSIIAGYHWFTDWGRDTMISLEGLTLATGRANEARWILQTFALHVRNGLLPNLFPEGGNTGLYHTADATLWFFHSLDRYLHWTGDRQLLHTLLPTMKEIIEFHQRGTDFGIGVDPSDGLLRQGADGYQLTWMDAKAGDWVVTPRRGKAVEINALWYNALRLMQAWLSTNEISDESERMRQAADRAQASFNQRFWNGSRNALFDLVDGEDGDDPAIRPNQIFAVSLPHAVLSPMRWHAVVSTVEQQLVTPYGLRTLEREHPDYKPTYHGDLVTRDAAYHQGTVWAWLIGHFIDAALRVAPERRTDLREMLNPLVAHLETAGVGSISEIFDAEAPFTPRGCIAQAWSVAELLRSLNTLDSPS